MVGICILNYNTYEKSCVCIDSCLRQKGLKFKIVLVDNSSTDESFIKLQKKYGSKIEYYQTGNNYGFAGGNNRGIKYCLEYGLEYVLLLNSDTQLVGEGLLLKLMENIKREKNCVVIAPTVYDVTSKGLIKHTNDYFYNKLLRIIGVIPINKMILPNLTQISEAHGSAMLIECKSFIEVGGFPEHYFMYCEESTFAKKILWAGHSILWYKDSDNYVLHHHDKLRNVAPWRLILMGRNRSLEFQEYKNKKRWLWDIIYKIYKIKIFMGRKRISNRYYYEGMCLGESSIKKNLSKQEIYIQGLNIYNYYKNLN